MGSSKNWTKQEEDKLMELLNNGKSYFDIAQILDRSENGVAIKAQRINRKLHGKQVESRKWTDEEVQQLIEYIKDFKEPEYVAETMNRTVNSVIVKAHKLGLAFKGKNRKYNNEEIQSIQDDWQDSRLSLSSIAKKYRRTPEAIKIIAQRNKFGPRNKYYEHLTINDVADCLNISHDRVRLWLKKGLKYTRKRVGKSLYRIKLDDLLDFMEHNPDLYNAVDVDTSIFMYEKPKWFKQKYIEDSQIHIDKWHYEYTNEEDKRILQLYKSGHTVEDIANKLKRTPSGIKTRLIVLSEGKMSPKYYTTEDIDILRRYSEYETLYEINNRLKTKRTIKGLEAKCTELGLKYHLNKNKCKQKISK